MADLGGSASDQNGGSGASGGTNGGSGLAQSAALAWVQRWDTQQQNYLPDREERFTALIDAVQESAGRADPVVLDLGCGPGSLSVRLLDRIPAATVVAIDADPLLLALGRVALAGRRGEPGRPGGLRFEDRDLREQGWSSDLGMPRPADAVVSTTALHWLPQDTLVAVYAEAATVLRPGGVLLNGDHLREDETDAPTLTRLGRALIEREERRRAPDGYGETWAGWWEAAAEDPALSDLAAARKRLGLESEHHGSRSGLLTVHEAALRAAGFTEVGTLWQRGENRLLCGVLSG